MSSGAALFNRRPPHFSTGVYIYPAVCEQILTEIVLVRGHEGLEDIDTEWVRLWLTFASNLAGEIPRGASGDELKAWVQRAVGALCSFQRMRERFERAQSQRGNNG